MRDVKMPVSTIPYKTDDTDLAAYILTLGANDPDLDRSNRRVAFSFELTKEQLTKVPHFYDTPAPISLSSFSDAKKKLLGMIKNV